MATGSSRWRAGSVTITSGFGTDMNALGNSPISSYADLRRVVRHLERKIAADRVRKLAIGNYARVLREVMEAAKA
jgi:microsomal dipeptidase-like Zn-dependent dipeptidase